jgi:hypothetical protein
MSFGKSSQTYTPELTPEQKAQIAAQTEFFTGTIKPTYEQAVKGATELYNVNAPGALAAAQNLAGTALGAQSVLGETGESALRTGITGLQSLFTPDYERQQVMAALAPAQAQYQKNLADLRTQFGATGNLGSARQALAERATAGQAAGMQAQTAAQIQKDIAAQRLAAAQALTGAGAGLVPGAMGAAGQVVSASMIPQELYNKYASVIFGTPSTAYNPNFAGTQGGTTTGMQFGLKYPGF